MEPFRSKKEMKNYIKRECLFGEGTGPTEVVGTWRGKYVETNQFFEIPIESNEEFLTNDDILAFLIHFRKIKKDCINGTIRLLQENQIDPGTDNPFQFMEEEDAVEYLRLAGEYQVAVEWLPLIEREADRRNMHNELGYYAL